MSVVTLRNGKSFTVDEGQSILNAALARGVVLDYSCRNGRCGVCEASVASGPTAVIQPEVSISEAGTRCGSILTCCRTVTGDCTLDITDLGRLAGQSPQVTPARIASIEDLSPTIRRIVLRFPPKFVCAYLPGQYLDIMARGVRRSYSIANAPRADGTVALDIRRYDSGVLSAYWFGDATEGDLVRAEMPLGTFFLREEPTKTIVFLATGTGIAPISALLEEIRGDPAVAHGAQLHVYWGNRSPLDFYWTPPEGIDLTFTRIVSRPDAEWSGRSGYIQDAVLTDGIDLTDATVYACGSQAMIDAAQGKLVAAGLDAGRYHYDAFVDTSAVEQT